MTLHPESVSALAEVRHLAQAKPRVVFVSGNFNIVHPGHLRLLKFAADCGDCLVVGVLDKSSPGAAVPEELRLEGVRAIGLVDHAFLLRDPPADFVAALRPDIIVKGKEHEQGQNPEQKVADSYGGKLLFGSGDFVFSSLDLLRNEAKETNIRTIRKPRDFLQRHHVSLGGLVSILHKFKGQRVLVIGDLIVDEYIACDPLGMSQEDPTIVVTPLMHERFVGGAGIVAAHAQSLGADVHFVTVTGKDPVAQFAGEKLGEYHVRATLVEDESRPTTLKQRYRAGGKTLLRVSHLKQHAVPQQVASQLSTAISDALDTADLVVFSDFNYGCLPQHLVDSVAAACRERNVPMVADCQSSSQVGDVSRFKDCLLLTPTEREARLAVRDFDSGLVVLADALRAKAHAKYVVMTLGAEGMLVHSPVPSPGSAVGRSGASAVRGYPSAQESGDPITDRLPPFNTAPRDPAGAGDSLFTCMSLALTSGANIWESAYLGAIAAACQVGRIGNTPLRAAELEAEILDEN